MAIDIFPIKYYSIFFFLSPICFFFPYHAAFCSLALFGVWHIFAEVKIWKEIKIQNENFRFYRKSALFSALGFSLLSLVPIVLNLLGVGKWILFSNLFLTLFGIWIFGFVVWKFVILRGNGFLLIAGFGMSLYFFFVWTRPTINYFLLVHLHNILPWIVIYQLTKNRRFVIPAFLVSFLLPSLLFFLFSIRGLTLSEISLPMELEQEIFRQVVHSEFEWIPGTTFLGYFAYQQIFHYFLWIYLIPKLLKIDVDIGFSKWRKEKKNKIWKISPIPFFILAALVLFLLFPIEFRKLYFAIGFFHIAIEYPLLIANLPSK